MDLRERLSWLRRSKLLQMLSEDDLKELAETASDHFFARGERIYAQGDPARALFFLKSGAVLLSRVSPDGKEKILGIASRGDIFGELVLASGGEQHLNQALCWEDSLVCSLSPAEMLRFMVRKPRMAVEMVRLLASRLMESQDEIASLSFNSTETRVLSTLLRLALERQESGRTVSLRLTHEQVAQMVGASRETVTGVLGRLRSLGMVAFSYASIDVDIEQVERRLGRAPATSARESPIDSSERRPPASRQDKSGGRLELL